MLLIAITLAAATPAPDQILAGKSFEKLASRTDALCPARRVRSITPGDLDYVQEDFEEKLPRPAMARLRSANKADRRCAGKNGLSCQTTVTLTAMDRIGMMPAFATYICAHPNPR